MVLVRGSVLEHADGVHGLYATVSGHTGRVGVGVHVMGMRIFVTGLIILLCYAVAHNIDVAVDKKAQCEQMGGIFLEIEQICLSQRAVLKMVHEPYIQRRDDNVSGLRQNR